MLLAKLPYLGSPRLDYWLDSLARYGSEHSCPHCGGTSARARERKYLVTRLFLCPDCSLQYRHPKESPSRNTSFYQEAYTQEDGITTDLPDAARLQYLTDTGFGEKNVGHYAMLFSKMYPGKPTRDVRIIDYGCSWGYQLYQFQQAGFACQGQEVSRHRAAFGLEKLGLDIVTDVSELVEDVDIFFSSHVIEHLPDPGQLIALGMGRLRSGGYFVMECPNGSDQRRLHAPELMRKAWGMVHPNLISDDFLKKAFHRSPYLITSSPFQDIAQRFEAWGGQSQEVGDLTGSNLLIIAKKS